MSEKFGVIETEQIGARNSTETPIFVGYISKEVAEKYRKEKRDEKLKSILTKFVITKS